MAEKRMRYSEEMNIKNTMMLRDILKTLPEFAKDFFRATSMTSSASTRCKYAYDIRVFFQFLKENHPLCLDKEITMLPCSILDRISALDLEEYIEYLKAYRDPKEGRLITNGEKGIKRKLSALRTFYAYYFKHEMIHTNPTVLIDMPKLHHKNIVRLESDEVASLLDLVEHGEHAVMSEHQKKYYEKNKQRDLAILTLLLGTGIRVSECVGLDLDDVDFRSNGVRVVRKGGNEMIVYFGDEVANALKAYIDGDRSHVEPVKGHEEALFYSAQRKRIGVKTVENMVKKYTEQITTTKKITPHKLRSTYGTQLYQETGDIYLVADVLGHKDVNTTKTHYAAMSDARRRSAAKAVHLRED